MLAIILGVFTVLLGAKAFTPNGIPLTREKNLTGTTAKVIGGFVILLGVASLASGIVSTVTFLGRAAG